MEALWQKLLKKNPTTFELCYLERWMPLLRNLVRQKILEQRPDIGDIRLILEVFKRGKREAKKQLRKSVRIIIEKMEKEAKK